MKYITEGRYSEIYGSRSEEHNFVVDFSNEVLYPYVFRNDVTGFDFITVNVRGTRKIPPTFVADTLCGPTILYRSQLIQL